MTIPDKAQLIDIRDALKMLLQRPSIIHEHLEIGIKKQIVKLDELIQK